MRKTTSDRKYTVYLHRNKINGKVYVGITSDVSHRWRGNGSGYRNNEHFYRAICKYGWANFDHIVLFDNLLREDACSKEIELIALYDATNPDKGYNRSPGGENTTLGLTCSESTREKISAKLKERYSDPQMHPMLGKHRSEATKRKLSIAHSGKVLSEEHKQHISETLKGRQRGAENPMARPVICVTTGEIFSTLTEAGQSIGVSRVAIQRCCKGLSKSAGGLCWAYQNEE